ncbi:MAG: hypothetical protein ACE5OS_08025 [Anaerolineae bacterium]
MPLLDEDLCRNFVQVNEDDTVADALERLRAQGGDDHWRIFVTHGPDIFSVLKVGELKKWLKSIGPALFDLRFADVQDWLPEAPAVQQQAVGIGAAEQMALKSPGGVVVALQGMQVAGCLYVAAKRGEVFPGSTMAQLYGEYISQAPDARAEWQPADVEPPVCPHCNHRGFYRYRVEDGTFYCSECGRTVPEQVT